MKKWLKRIRGALGLGLLWAAAWSGVGAIIAVVTMVLGAGAAADIGVFAVLLAVPGFVGGAIFSTVLGITEGRRTFDEMSLPRFAGWGAVGGLLLSVLLFAMGNGESSRLVTVVIASIVTLMGAGSAAGSLALARRADDRDLLDVGADVDDIGLSKEEKRELLGK